MFYALYMRSDAADTWQFVGTFPSLAERRDVASDLLQTGTELLLITLHRAPRQVLPASDAELFRLASAFSTWRIVP